MPATNRSTLCSFDADRVRRVVQNAVTGPLYIDDRTVSMYDSEDAMLDRFEKIHTNVHMDFTQIELFRNTLFPAADRVEYIITAMDFLTILRVYVGDDCLFVATEPDEPVEPIVDAIEGAVPWPGNQNS